MNLEFKQKLLTYLYKAVDISEISQITMLCDECSVSDIYIKFSDDHKIMVCRLIFKEDFKE